MKLIFTFVFLLFAFLAVNAQNILVKDIKERSASLVLSNNETILIKFNQKEFNVEGSLFYFKDLSIFSDSAQQNKIGKYEIDQLILNDGRTFTYKFDKRKNTIQIKDKNKDIVFLQGLKFLDSKKKILDKIIISKDSIHSEIVEYWLSLCIMNKLYGNQNKELFKQLMDASIFGATVGTIQSSIK